MIGWAGLIGVFAPFAVLLLASWSPLKGRNLLGLSLFINLISWAGFVLLVGWFYTKEGRPGSLVYSPLQLVDYPWTGPLFFRWDFQLSVLSLAASTVVMSFHFLAGKTLESSRSTVAALSGYLGCLLGALGSGQLFLFTVFLAGSILPRFVFTGVDVKKNGISQVRESAFLGIVSLFSLIIVVLAFNSPFRASLRSWFLLEGSSHVVLPGTIGFALLLCASAIASGLFPFHGNSRKIFETDSVERLVPLALQPLFGFVILFRFSVELFPGEFQAFSSFFLALFSVGLAMGALGFVGSKSARDRAFWLQQAASFLIVIGFFSLNRKGWHGASVLLVFQILALPFLLMVLACHERRGPFPAGRVTEFPAIALSTASAALFSLFLPVSIGFYGLLLVVWSLVPAQNWLLPFVIIAVPLVALGGMKSMYFQLGERSTGEQVGEFRDLSVTERLAVFPIGLVLLLLGLFPKILTGPLGTSAEALLLGLGLMK